MRGRKRCAIPRRLPHRERTSAMVSDDLRGPSREMPTKLLLVATIFALTVTSVAGRGQELITSGPVDVVVSEWGCDALQYTVPSGHPPELRVRNRADESMVFAVTEFDQLVRVRPGEQVMMPLHAFVWGTFSFLCMTEAAHDSVMGPVIVGQYTCGLDAFALRPRALSEGRLVIEPHARLQELGSSLAP